MILSRRKAHFYAVVTLAATLPIVFLAGLLLRPSVPTTDAAVDELFAIAGFSVDNTQAPFSDPSSRLSDQGIEIRAEVTSLPKGLSVLEVQPDVIQFADVLVYWQEGNQPSTDSGDRVIGDRAVLLGQLSGQSRRRFRLPSELQDQQGQLILYSRGQDTLIAMFPFTLAPDQP